MLTIEYQRGMRQSVIESATFNFEGDKQLALSMADVVGGDGAGRVVGQSVKIALRDTKFGDEELSASVCLKDGVDLIRILQRMLRQAASFKPEEKEEKDEGDAIDG